MSTCWHEANFGRMFFFFLNIYLYSMKIVLEFSTKYFNCDAIYKIIEIKKKTIVHPFLIKFFFKRQLNYSTNIFDKLKPNVHI